MKEIKTDCAEWGLSGLMLRVISFDFGLSHDHPAVAVLGLYSMPGEGQVVAVQHLEQWKIGVPPIEQQSRLIQAREQHGTSSVPVVTVVDATNNLPFVSGLAEAGIRTPYIGCQITGGDTHGSKPTPLLGSKRIVTPIWQASRKLLIDELMAAGENRAIRITKTGGAKELEIELSNLKREISASRRVIYKTAPGGHDDLIMAVCMGLLVINHRQAMGLARLTRRSAGTTEQAPSVAAWT